MQLLWGIRERPGGDAAANGGWTGCAGQATRSPAPAAGRGPGTRREAIAHAFSSEYQRILTDMRTDAVPSDVPPGLSGAGAVPQCAFAWRVIAARIPPVPGRCWPTWLRDHLHAAAAMPPGVGAEYRRQRARLVDLLGGRGRAGRPVASRPTMA